MTGEGRWALPDRAAALDRCTARNKEHLRCVLDILGGQAKNAEQARAQQGAHMELLRILGEAKAGASLAVKPSLLGAPSDRKQCRSNLLELARAGLKRCVPVELDMEGRGLVDFTLQTALEAASRGLPVTLTLQAYLYRTAADLERALDGRLRLRMVKGA